MQLEGNTILIVSPQAWGKMFVSKHHYAIELAKRGNTVYFLNPPDQNRFGIFSKVQISIPEKGSVYLVDHQLYFPYWLKFKASVVFHWLMRFHVKRLLTALKAIDIVWSFDIGNLYPLPLFGKKVFKIFHPVDEPLNKAAFLSARGSNIIFSVTHEILEKYESINVPKHFVNHGVAESFLGMPTEYVKRSPVRVGFSGNLLRKDIDREVLIQIIQENENCLFEFWGSYQQAESNVGGTEDSASAEFISVLRRFKNVVLHGAVSAEQLATEIQVMDAFLICYDVLKDQSKGTNYHKVMEYLATGKVIIANNITTYQHSPELVTMVSSRTNNQELPPLFASCIQNLSMLNQYENTEKRINFARQNTYARQIIAVEKILSSIE